MSLGSFLRKVGSSLDFWDVAENKQQRAQIDEDERRRKQREQAARQAVRQPGLSVQAPNQPTFDVTQPLVKAAAQSDAKIKPPAAPAQSQSDTLKVINKSTGFQPLVKAPTADVVEKPKPAPEPSVLTKLIKHATPGNIWDSLKYGVKEEANTAKTVLQGAARIPETVIRSAVLDKATQPGSADQKDKNTGLRKFFYGEDPIKTYATQGKDLGELSQKIKPGNPVNPATGVLLAPFLGALDLTPGGKGGKKALEKTAKEAAEEIAAKEAAEKAAKESAVMPGSKKVVQAPETIDLGGGMKSTNLVKVAREPKPIESIPAPGSQSATPSIDVPVPKRGTIPDVTNPIALAKADNTAPVKPVLPADQAPMADFSQSINAPLQKVAPETPPSAVVPPAAEPTPTEVAQAAQAGELPTPAVTDVAGNPVVVSDAEAARQLADEGGAIPRAESPVAATEDEMARAADQAAAAEVNPAAAAPRAREQATNLIESDSARLDVQDSFKVKDPTVIEDIQRQAETNVRNMSDGDLVARYGLEPEIKTPQEYFDSIAAVERLGRTDTNNPAVVRALTNALDGISSFASRAGRDLRMVKELFKNLPSPMKKKYLVDRIESKLGAELPDAERSRLINLIDIADNTDAQMQDIAGRLVKAQRDIELGAPVDARLVKQDIDNLNELATKHEFQQGDAFQYSQALLGKATAGARVAQGTRTAMLSSPLRRAADVVTTGIVSAGDTAANAISGLAGRALNKLPGQAGRFRETRAGDYGKLVGGNVEGAKESAAALFKDQHRVPDYMGELQRATRADANAAVRTRPGRFVGDLTEAATNLTKGQNSQRLRELARQDGQKLGLKSDDLKLYTEIGETIPDQVRKYEAAQYHLRTNNLHDNKVSAAFRRIASTIEQMFPQGGPILNVLTVPFKSYQAGNINRLFTDKTLIGNVFQFAKAAKNGDAQGMLDVMGKAAVNTGETVAIGMGLSAAGLISDTNDNGEDWAGPYVKTPFGSVPVGFFGPGGLNVLMGHNLQRLTDDGNVDEFINQVGKQAISFMNVEDSLGGGNQLQQLFSGPGDFSDRLIKTIGDTARRPIPAFLGDVNAIANTVTGQDKSLTKATNDEGNTDYLKTELNRTIAKLGLDSTLPRDLGKSSQNVLDRITGGTHSTDDTKAADQERDVKKSLKQIEAELKKDKVPLTETDINAVMEDGDYQKARRGWEYQLAKAEADGAPESKKDKIRDKITQADLQGQGVPVTKEGIEARAEDGDYESAIKGAQYQAQKLQNDKDVPKSKKQDAEDDVTRLKVTRDGEYPPAVIKMYSDTSLSEWRSLGNPESEDYDPELYDLLWSYDKDLADNGVSRSTKDGAKQKFAAAKGRGGAGGRGGSGGGRGKPAGFTTDIATQSFEGDKSFSPIKAVAANFATPTSAIPVIAPVPNNDPSKLKKITVKKGGRS